MADERDVLALRGEKNSGVRVIFIDYYLTYMPPSPEKILYAIIPEYGDYVLLLHPSLNTFQWVKVNLRKERNATFFSASTS